MQHEASVVKKMSDIITYNFNEISGKMITVEYAVTSSSISQIAMDPEEYEKFVKTELCQKIVHEMYKQKFIEFTRQVDHNHGVRYRARIFVTPDDQVRILRQHIK